MHCRRCVRALIFSILPLIAWADEGSNFTSLYDAFPQLIDLQQPLRGNIAGGQNFTRCCLQAVYDSYQVVDGQVTPNPAHPFITLSAGDLMDTAFPCGAEYNGSSAGAPIVSVPYSWCSQNCAGWEVSSNTILTQWIQPFVGFILPAAVFCLNVPRRKSLTVSDSLFHDHTPQLRDHWRAVMRRVLGINPPPRVRTNTRVNSYSSALTFAATVAEKMGLVHKILDFFVKLATFFLYFWLVVLEMIARGSIAAAIALVDTVMWLTTVFALAAPMTLSGLYEASIDRVVLDALEKEMRKPVDVNDGQTLKHRIHLFYGILVGNLVLEDSPEMRHLEEGERSAWHDIARLVNLIPDNLGQDQQLGTELKRTAHVRLSSMLGCQASFGASIGAPVVFFLGSFLFSVFGNLSVLGDNDTSHALAFGEWWMTIPYVAVVSGCLLAGNNPNTLEAIFSGVETWEGGKKAHLETIYEAIKNFIFRPYGAFYDAVYQPVWMWERGRNKRNWIRKIQQQYYSTTRERKPRGLWRPVRDWAKSLRTKYGYEPERLDFSAPIPQTLPDLDFLDWMRLLLVAVVLIVGPFILAFLTSYFTPYVGLSCRSLTFLVYFLFQVWLSAIWFWDFYQDESFEVWYHFSVGRVDDEDSPGGHGSARGFNLRIPTPLTILTVFGMFGSAFTAILGTFMQLLGLFRNCRCIVPVTSWGSADFQNFMIPISTNTPDSIYYARKYWMPTGWASILLMVVVCYVAWWYQRHWRRMFNELIDKLLLPAPGADSDSGTTAQMETITGVRQILSHEESQAGRKREVKLG